MRVLLTGAHGRVGTAIMDHLEADYDWTLLDREDSPERETEVVDVADREAVDRVVAGHDAVVHLAADPGWSPGTWSSVLENNIIGCYNVLDAAAEAGVNRFVFASTNHVLGGYQDFCEEELFSGEMILDDETPVRPDSYYGVSKVFGEALCQYYVDYVESPDTAYMLRIGGVHEPDYDRPSDSKHGRCGWMSRRDCAHLFDRCLQADGPDYAVFNSVSDNAERYYDLEYARQAIGFRPQDDGGEWRDSEE